MRTEPMGSRDPVDVLARIVLERKARGITSNIITDPSVVAHLSCDQLARLGNIERERRRRAESKRRQERMLLKSTRTERVLYGVAYESTSMQEAGFIYLHAFDRNDAINQILPQRYGALKGYRIVGVAPAVGAWSADGKTSYIYA